MKIVARHKSAPLVALSDGSVIDTEELEVVGTGAVSGSDWEFNVDGVECDPRWVEISLAEASSLSVNEKKANAGERTFRAPKTVQASLRDGNVDAPLSRGQGMTLDQLEELLEHDGVDGHALDWISQTLNKHQPNPDADHESALFDAAEPELDYAQIDAAMDGTHPAAAVAAAGTPEEGDSSNSSPVTDPPPGQFSKIVYLAVIEQDDTQSVQDLVALVQTPSGSADAYKYQGGKAGWKEDPSFPQKLQGAAPPPIKELKDWQTNSIIEQINASTGDGGSDDTTIEGVKKQVQASGFELPVSGVIWGPDNKQILSIVAASHAHGHWTGNAQRLRDYWQTGEGGAKIRWNTPGDWKRCHRHLSKYLGVRAAGYCQLMHHRMTGTWTGSRNNIGGNGHHGHGF